jgi:hypothetical protein
MKHITISNDGMHCTICGATEKVKYPIEVDKLNDIGDEFSKKHNHTISITCISCGEPIKKDLWCDKCFQENLKPNE